MVRDKACIRFFLEACCELWWGSLCLLVTLQAALTPVTDKQPLYIRRVVASTPTQFLGLASLRVGLCGGAARPSHKTK